MPGQKRKDNSKLLEELKAICPEHRRKDLESLIRKEKGNKDKINEQIQNWWDEPVPVAEEKWEDVSKKKKPVAKPNERSSSREFTGRRDRDRDRDRDSERGGGGRGYGRSGDRGGRGYGRGSAGGRGGGPERRGRGRGGGDRPGRKPLPAAAQEAAKTLPDATAAATAPAVAPVADKGESANAAPTPSMAKPLTARPLQGAWGARAAAAAAPAPTPAAAPPAPAPIAPEPVAEDIPETTTGIGIGIGIEESFVSSSDQREFDVGVVSAQDPTPAGATVTDSAPVPVVVPESKPVPVAPAGGNVWATKGSAHLINKEKKPLSPPAVVEEISFQMDDPLMPAPDLVVESSEHLDENLVNVNGTTMNGASGWVTETSPVGPVSVDVVDAPLLDIPAPEEIVLQVPVVEPPVVPEAAPIEIETALKPTSVLNMGHWETGEGEEAVSHDFGFGSFGQENDVTSVDETTISSSANNNNNVPVTTSAPVPVHVPVKDNSAPVAAPTVSPARPPPGLGIGMPPMPEKIVHVHELENKLENASLNNKDDEPTKSDALPDNHRNVVPQHAAPATIPPEGFAQMPHSGVPQQSYAGQYGMGMYNYNGQAGGVATPNGFMNVGVPGGAPLGVPPQQQKQQGVGVGVGQQAGGLPQQQQASIYGAPNPNATTQTQSSDTSAGNNDTNGNNGTNPPNSGMPPGMAGMAHYNAAALFYGQQPYLAGQPHGVSAYGFGYAGQFGGVQAGYGYQQVMGQGGGYGQPYDDQAQHHGGNNHQGGYNNKNSGGGGYRGRNNHHNQYQNQYNPQGHGAYGGQPYNMGYNDHFNQRGGYGQQQIDPYMQQNNGGYHQENDHGKGNKNNKGNNRNNFGNSQNMHQYQQQGGNQFGGLQGAATSDSNPTFQGWGNGGL